MLIKKSVFILILFCTGLTARAGHGTPSIAPETDIPISACENRNLVRQISDPSDWSATPRAVGPSSLWNLGFSKSKSWIPTRVLVGKIFDRLESALAQDSVTTRKIVDCLGQISDWKSEFSESCRPYEKYLREEVPVNLHMLRIHMSLAFPTAYKSGVEVWDPELGIEQNLYLKSSWPISGQKEPLTKEEEAAARQAFFIFWDQMIERNLLRFEKLVQFQPSNPFGFQEILAGLQEAKAKASPEERAERAGRITYPFWQGIITKELRAFHNENLLLLTKEVDAIRALALITAADPKPEDLKKAFIRILNENSRLREKTVELRKQLPTMDSVGAEPLQFAFSLTEVLEDVMGKNPEYCGLAVTIVHHVNNRDFRKEWGSELVLFGSSFFMSPWISVPLFAGSGAYWVVEGRREYFETLQKALATNSKAGSLVSMTEISTAAQTYENAFLELPLAFMGFPGGTAMAKWKAVMKVHGSEIAN